MRIRLFTELGKSINLERYDLTEFKNQFNIVLAIFFFIFSILIITVLVLF
jgi:hypothetical protein